MPAVFARFFNGQVYYQSSISSGISGLCGKFLYSHPQNGIEIRKNNQSRRALVPNLGGYSEHLIETNSILQCPLTGALNYRSISDRIAEWHSQLDDLGSCRNGS